MLPNPYFELLRARARTARIRARNGKAEHVRTIQAGWPDTGRNRQAWQESCKPGSWLPSSPAYRKDLRD